MTVQPSELVFFLLAGLAIGSGAGVAFSKNVIYSAFSLLGTFLGVAGLYVYLSADFLAVAQVLVYIGGVLVLILFAVMLTAGIADMKVSNQAVGRVPAFLLAALLVGGLGFVAVSTPWKTGPTMDYTPTAAKIGELFLQKYLLPFEIGSVLLLAALVGAVVIARREAAPSEGR